MAVLLLVLVIQINLMQELNMSVIDWAKKPYPWNEIGLQWVAELQALAADRAESRTVQETLDRLPKLRREVYAAARGSEAAKKGPWV